MMLHTYAIGVGSGGRGGAGGSESPSPTLATVYIMNSIAVLYILCQLTGTILLNNVAPPKS